MKRYWILPFLASWLLAAHLFRVRMDWLALGALAMPLLFLYRRQWVRRVYQAYLVVAAVVWIERLLFLRHLRVLAGEPWLRLTVILSAVVGITLVGAWMMGRAPVKKWFSDSLDPAVHRSAFTVFLITSGILTLVTVMVRRPMLLLERYVPGSAGIEILLVGLYAAWICERYLVAGRSSRLRRRIWLFFSLVFFAQFILGLAGLEHMLMSGKLHLPVPAMIIAGPLFRGGSLFMVILFSATLLIIGPAWCSHLCYVGAWDNQAAALAGSRPRPIAKQNNWRWFTLAGVVAVALIGGTMGWPSWLGTLLGIGFGAAGVLFMVLVSRPRGTMIHCTAYCPIGVLADLLGKVSPFRLTINSSCDGCGACSAVCRFNALTPADIEKKRPALSCSLCGDCIASCTGGAIGYRFLSLSPQRSRRLFVSLVVSLHAVFLALARI